MQIAVDTCIVIDFLRGADPGAGYVEKLLKTNDMVITAITLFELQVGIKADSRRDRLIEQLFSIVPVLPFDMHAAIQAGQIENHLRAQGNVIGPADTFIAAICLSRGIPLATHKIEHFSRVPGLKVLPVQDAID